VPLRGLLESEAARTGATVVGPEAAVEGDAMLLRHVARNLLENAARYGGGQEVRAVIEPGGDDGPAAVVIAVEDRGPGIPEEDRERIFAPFYRRPGHAAASGHGLGLALVRQVARYHGGDARHVPRPGGGSRFEVKIPARNPQRVPDLQALAPAGEAGLRSTRG
jgi:signal transduction histidine kinase